MTISPLLAPSPVAAPNNSDVLAADAAVARAERLLRRSDEIERIESRPARNRRTRLHALVVNRGLANFTRVLTDEVARIDDHRLAARRFTALVATADTRALSKVDRSLLTIGAVTARLAPKVVMPIVLRRLRREAEGTIVFDHHPGLERHLAGRSCTGDRSNINILGEAILGQDEAAERMHLIESALRREDVNYVSVKISAIHAQVSALAFDETVAAVAEQVRRLYRLAMTFSPAKFVNLDMEEYRDLALTVAVFQQVLSEPEFRSYDAGIVLQAYLPDSHHVACELSEWAQQRRVNGGGRIKMRIVKGANLAMESVEAELHGWEQAPYQTKAEVDASYKAILELLLDPRYDDAVRVGLASHNLFDVAWGLGRRDELSARGAAGRLDFEMLEGMAPAQAQAVHEAAGSVLLYTPVVRPDDFTAAIAYLVRRLDENTAPDNFLRNLFDLKPGNAVFAAEEDRFRRAIVDRQSVSREPRRIQDRLSEFPRDTSACTDGFSNEPDTDFALAANRRWIAGHLAAWVPPTEPILPIVNGVAIHTHTYDSVDLTCSPFGAYRVGLADLPLVDEAVRVANAATHRWSARSPEERASLIRSVGEQVAEQRGHILATMAHDAGKTIGEGDPELSEAIDFAHYYAQSALDLGSYAGAVHTPVGPVVIAPPWNFPFAIALGGVLAALAAGNAVILKPAPQAILTGELVARCCWDAGIPGDALQFLPCPDDEVGRALITHEHVGAVILTGALSTAEMFLTWKPSLRLHAESSGKNAMIITSSADIELAVKDLVKSAFGHAGQKCSAASLAIVEASVYDDPSFFRRLADATRTLRVGPGFEVATDVGPLIDPPSDNLLRALTTLDNGESWLVEPASMDESGRLWSPGIRVGVTAGSWFHRTECFGPVLGVIRARDLTHALELQNAVEFGLTAGLQSLDSDEIDRWVNTVEAGNLYVNRGITGAIVQRQPFGGWKRSVVGPTVKAGGPRYVASLCRWTADVAFLPASVVDAYREWAAEEVAAEHDPSGLRSETNILRFRPLPGGVAVRLAADQSSDTVALVAEIGRLTTCNVHISLASEETDESFADRIGGLGVDRLRILGPASDVIRAAAHRCGIAVDDSDLSPSPALELPRWMREQSVSRTRHRHGHIA